MSSMLYNNIGLSSSIAVSNPKLSKIIVAIDGSEHSFKAAEYALDIAKSFSAQLFAITVTSTPQSYHLKQEDVLGESREMVDSKTWLEGFIHAAKTDNIELKTELIN